MSPCVGGALNNTQVLITGFYFVMTVPCKVDLVHRVPILGTKEKFLQKVLCVFFLLGFVLFNTLSCTCTVYKSVLSISASTLSILSSCASDPTD